MFYPYRDNFHLKMIDTTGISNYIRLFNFVDVDTLEDPDSVYVNLEINRSYYNDIMQRNNMYESKKGEFSMANTKEILALAVELADVMLRNGAEIYRIEDTVIHILKAYKIESFALQRLLKSGVSVKIMTMPSMGHFTAK